MHAAPARATRKSSLIVRALCVAAHGASRSRCRRAGKRAHGGGADGGPRWLGFADLRWADCSPSRA